MSREGAYPIFPTFRLFFRHSDFETRETRGKSVAPIDERVRCLHQVSHRFTFEGVTGMAELPDPCWIWLHWLTICGRIIGEKGIILCCVRVCCDAGGVESIRTPGDVLILYDSLEKSGLFFYIMKNIYCTFLPLA